MKTTTTRRPVSKATRSVPSAPVAGDTMPSPPPVQPRPVSEVRIAGAKREWHGATQAEFDAATKLVLQVRENRPKRDHEMTLGEMLCECLTHFSDEPFARSVLRTVAAELWTLWDDHAGDNDERHRGLVDTLGMIARRCEIAATLDARLEESAR
jgi:hypothetical protein